MTAKQNSLYWREWAAVKRAEPKADRHALHQRALGTPASHVDFSNDDFDLVLAEFRAVSRPADLDAQVRQIRMPKERLMYSIVQLAVPAYAAKVAHDKFGITDLDRLDVAQLQQLRITLIERSRAAKRKQSQKELL